MWGTRSRGSLSTMGTKYSSEVKNGSVPSSLATSALVGFCIVSINMATEEHQPVLTFFRI